MAGDVRYDPQPGFFLVLGGERDHGGKECVGCLGRVIKHDFPITFGKRGQARREFRLGYGAPKPAMDEIVLGGHAGHFGVVLSNRKLCGKLAARRGNFELSKITIESLFFLKCWK